MFHDEWRGSQEEVGLFPKSQTSLHLVSAGSAMAYCAPLIHRIADSVGTIDGNNDYAVL